MAIQYGEDEIGYFVPETTYATAVKPAATDAFPATSIVITPNYERVTVPDRRGTRSVVQKVAGKKGVSWSVEASVRPSGAAGTAPDLADVLKNTFGTQTVVTSTSVAYTLLKDPSGLSGTLYRKLTDILEGCYGAIVQSASFSFASDAFLTASLQGIGSDVLRSGTGQANGAGSSTATLISDDASHFSKYGIVAIDDDDNSGAGYQISSISAQTLTLESTASWSDNDAITPMVPTGTITGDPLYGTIGSMSWDGGSTTVDIISGSAKINTGLGLFTPYGSDVATKVTLEGERTAEFEITMLMDSLQYQKVGEAYEKVSQNVKLTVGSAAGARVRLNLPQTEIDSPELSGGSGLIQVTLRGDSIASSSFEDEFNIMFD